MTADALRERRTPTQGPNGGWGSAAPGLVALAISALALALAPLVLDGSYSWIEHTTSEAGGQGVEGAWLARTGFLMFGLAVIWIAGRCRDQWLQPATFFHLVFAVNMLGVAAFSLRSWQPAIPYDGTEDLLHSVAATAMGFAFAFGVTAVGVRIWIEESRWRPLDGVAVAASVALPLWMGLDGSIDGAVQRLMFAIAYLWYGWEAIRGR